MIKLSDYVIRYLEQIGSKHMFMLPGGGAMHLNDSLGNSKKIQYVVCLHEQACSMAAEAYARVTNKPGLLMVTTGPGGTNALTGLAGAYLESTPLIVISGQVKRLDMIRDQHIRQQGMQELDIISVVKPITKYAALVDQADLIKYHLDRALYEATHGKPGPVWLDIPLDIQATMIDETKLVSYEPFVAEKKGYLDRQVSEVIEHLNKAERPVLFAGNGIRLAGANEDFLQLASELNIPVLTSWNGIDLITEDNPLYFGRPGGLGHRYANFIQQNSDFFMDIGGRMNLLQTGYNFDGFAREAFKVMVDIEEAELHKINVRPDLAICADAKEFIDALLARKDEIKKQPRKDWFAYCNLMKKKYPLIAKDAFNKYDCVNTYCLVDEISNQMKPGEVYVSGSSGSCIDVSMQGFKVKKGQRVFCTKGLASMGYGLPSSIGACFAIGRKPVVTLMGDGGFQMNIQELQTIKTWNLPIKIFVLSNGGYGAIQATQTNLFNKHFVACNPQSNLQMPDLEKIAAAYGLKYVKIAKDGELHDKIAEVLSYQGPVLVEAVTPIGLTASPKQVSYRNSQGQMESLPLEYMNPVLDEKEFESDMLIPLFKKN
jgi:acetolactate synthase-1/2/3 large subunit